MDAETLVALESAKLANDEFRILWTQHEALVELVREWKASHIGLQTACLFSSGVLAAATRHNEAVNALLAAAVPDGH